jgi:hypothetical protein
MQTCRHADMQTCRHAANDPSGTSVPAPSDESPTRRDQVRAGLLTPPRMSVVCNAAVTARFGAPRRGDSLASDDAAKGGGSPLTWPTARGASEAATAKMTCVGCVRKGWSSPSFWSLSSSAAAAAWWSEWGRGVQVCCSGAFARVAWGRARGQMRSGWVDAAMGELRRVRRGTRSDDGEGIVSYGGALEMRSAWFMDGATSEWRSSWFPSQSLHGHIGLEDTKRRTDGPEKNHQMLLIVSSCLHRRWRWC